MQEGKEQADIQKLESLDESAAGFIIVDGIYLGDGYAGILDKAGIAAIVSAALKELIRGRDSGGEGFVRKYRGRPSEN